MKLGAVKFLNAYPLYWGLQFEPGISVKKDIPSRLADDLLRHELDIAIISSIEYHKHKNIFNYYPDLCIAAKGHIDSIRLYPGGEFSKKMPVTIESICQWLQEQKKLRIYYDIATRSSLSMLKVLLNEYCPEVCNKGQAEFVQVAPPFEKLIAHLKPQEMVLLIGDSALRLKEIPSIDMGEFYNTTFQRSFVYAIWVYRPVTGGQARDILINAFDIGQKNYDALIQDALAEFGFDEKFTRNYLTQIVQYKFSNELKNDMSFFFEKFDNLRF